MQTDSIFKHHKCAACGKFPLVGIDYLCLLWDRCDICQNWILLADQGGQNLAKL